MDIDIKAAHSTHGTKCANYSPGHAGEMLKIINFTPAFEGVAKKHRGSINHMKENVNRVEPWENCKTIVAED